MSTGLYSGTQTTGTTSASAPNWQVPYQQYGLNQAYQQYQNVNSPQQLVAPFSPLQNSALSNIQGLSNNNPTLGATQNYLQNTLSGNPANNPYLSQQFNLAANNVQNQLSSEFGSAGRNIIGSLPVQSDEMNNLATQLYGGAYNTGVQQQENAAAMAPGLVNQQLGLQQGAFNAGQQVQNLGQQYITAPQQFLQQYLNQTNQGLGTTATTSQPYSPLLQGIQTAGLGSSLGSSVGNLLGGSTGSSIGSLLGALGGAFA